MRDERQGVDFFTIGLRVQCRVAIKVGFQAGRAGEGQLQVFGFRQWAEAQLGRVHSSTESHKKAALEWRLFAARRTP